MGSISGVSGMSNAWKQVDTQRSQMQARLFERVDADSSGSVDKSELSDMVSDLNHMSGTQLDAGKLFKTMDSNNDGSLTSDELAADVDGLMAASPSTVDFAGQRGANAAEDDLFAKVDSNADGSVDEAEMSAFADKIKSDTGLDSPASFGDLDTDGDGKLSQTEFEAGKPDDPDGLQDASAAQDPDRISITASSITIDLPDGNPDETASELQRLAGALNDFVSSADSSATTADVSDSITALAKQVYEQIASGMTNSSNVNTLSTSA